MWIYIHYNSPRDCMFSYVKLLQMKTAKWLTRQRLCPQLSREQWRIQYSLPVGGFTGGKRSYVKGHASPDAFIVSELDFTETLFTLTPFFEETYQDADGAPLMFMRMMLPCGDLTNHLTNTFWNINWEVDMFASGKPPAQLWSMAYFVFSFVLFHKIVAWCKFNLKMKALM